MVHFTVVLPRCHVISSFSSLLVAIRNMRGFGGPFTDSTAVPNICVDQAGASLLLCVFQRQTVA